MQNAAYENVRFARMKRDALRSWKANPRVGAPHCFRSQLEPSACVQSFYVGPTLQESKEITEIRGHVASAIARRDGVSCDAECIFLTNGASEGIKLLFSMLVRRATNGVLLPLPQYPLYSAAVTLAGGRRVDYFLDENGQRKDIDELARWRKAAWKARVCAPSS